MATAIGPGPSTSVFAWKSKQCRTRAYNQSGMTRFSCALVAMSFGCGASPTPDRSSGPEVGASTSPLRLRVADRSGSVAQLRYSLSDPLRLHVTATLGADLPPGVSKDDTAWIVVRCQDGSKVISGRDFPRDIKRSKYVSASVRIGREELPRRCSVDVFGGDGHSLTSTEHVLLGSYCISNLQLTAGKCPGAIEAVEPEHAGLRADWWSGAVRPDGLLHLNVGIEQGARSYEIDTAEVVITCPTKRGRIVDGFQVATATSGVSSSPQSGDIESEDGFVLGPSAWPSAAGLDRCDVKLQAVSNTSPPGTRHREVFERACWQGGAMHRGKCAKTDSPLPPVSASTRPFRADAMIRKTDSDVFPYALVVELAANPGATLIDVELDGHCTVDGKRKTLGTPIGAMELERLAPGDIMRERTTLLKSMPSECRIDFATSALTREPVRFASVCLRNGKSVPC